MAYSGSVAAEASMHTRTRYHLRIIVPWGVYIMKQNQLRDTRRLSCKVSGRDCLRSNSGLLGGEIRASGVVGVGYDME